MNADHEELLRFRRAEEIQLRRGWHAVRDKHTGRWKVGEFCGAGDFLRWIRAHRFETPTDAILEADAWYAEHVESQSSPNAVRS